MISLRRVAVRQGTFALENVCLEIAAGEYAALMGKTGSGKTTVLEAICGLRSVAAGRVWLMGRDVTSLKPAARGIGYVPQDGALFSTLSVRDHLAFALVVRRWSRSAIDARVAELAQMLGIGHLLHRKPRGLSGGEAQRVVLGRALAMRPGILLLDEPLSALDDDTRQEIYQLLRTVRRQEPVTVLHVTHNRAEAECLADRMFELRDGTIVVPGAGPGPGHGIH
jgi:ABC-type sugar transport system ATPase subunit